MLRLAVPSLLLASAALAQSGSGDWSSFPPPTAGPASKSEARRRVEERLQRAQQAKAQEKAAANPEPVPGVPVASAPAAPAEEARVVETRERYLPGSEPHSPSTIGNKYNAPANHRVTAGNVGVGTLRVPSADLGPTGILRLSLLGEYFSQRDFPVLRAIDVRAAGTFGISYVPLRWLEAYVAYGAASNSNTRSSPRLIQSLGDLSAGAKLARKFATGFHAGVDLRGQSFSGVGNVSRYVFGFTPRALATYDFRERFEKVPLRVSGAFGATFDGTGRLVTSQPLNAAEEFALGIHRYHRLLGGVALEAPLPIATPYFEYNVAYPLGVPNGRLPGPDGVSQPVSRVLPQTIGFGAKITAVRDLTFTAGVDLGLSRRVGLGLPATPPYNLFFGAGFNIDPLQRGGTKVVETIREKAVAQAPEKKTGKVAGTVLDAKTGRPIPGVIVATVGAGLPPVASDLESGRFLTHELPTGPVTLSVQKEGYKPATQKVVLAAGQTMDLELSLEAEPRKAQVDVAVTHGKKPIAALVSFKGPVEQQAVTQANMNEPVQLDLPPGPYAVVATAQGMQPQTRELQVTEGGRFVLTFDLAGLAAEPKKVLVQEPPKRRLVIIQENKLQILQKVNFGTNQANILPSSNALLQQVADVIKENDIKKIRVEGHTDNQGDKAVNRKLSEDRAQSVVSHLIRRGVDPIRLEAKGYGDSRPVAPNITARGRELNRRVEFVIVER